MPTPPSSLAFSDVFTKIGAIKLIRLATDLGLVSSKKLIETVGNGPNYTYSAIYDLVMGVRKGAIVEIDGVWYKRM